jgi:hypothetical protein
MASRSMSRRRPKTGLAKLKAKSHINPTDNQSFRQALPGRFAWMDEGLFPVVPE